MRTIPSLRLMALTLPAVALTSCLSGYFVAVRRVWKSACIQVVEEIIRILCTVFLLSRTISGGLESALLALALANAIADIFSGCAIMLLFRFDKRKYIAIDADREKTPAENSVARRLLSVTMPVAVAAYIRSGLVTLEHMLIPIGLQRFGQSHGTALASYGTLHSMALPVVLFPCALLNSFTALLIPELTEAHVRAEHNCIRRIMQRVFSLTLLFSIGTAGVMLFFSHELGQLLYHSEEAARYIRVLAPLIPVMYMDSATDAMLKGLGQQVYSMKVNIADASVSVLLVRILLPHFGILGYIMTIYITELLNATLSITRLLRVSDMHPHVMTWVIKPLTAIVGATSLTHMLFFILPNISENAASLTVQIIFSCIIYIGFLLLLGALKKRDIHWLKSFVIHCKTP